MENIENLYKNADVEKKRYCEFDDECPFLFGHKCEDCDVDYKPEGYIYPPFTAEKLLELIVFLINRKYPLLFSLDEGKGKISKFILGIGITKILNNIWQDLTEDEKQQIKEILQ